MMNFRISSPRYSHAFDPMRMSLPCDNTNVMPYCFESTHGRRGMSFDSLVAFTFILHSKQCPDSSTAFLRQYGQRFNNSLAAVISSPSARSGARPNSLLISTNYSGTSPCCICRNGREPLDAMELLRPCYRRKHIFRTPWRVYSISLPHRWTVPIYSRPRRLPSHSARRCPCSSSDRCPNEA